MKQMTKALACRFTALVKQWPPESMATVRAQDVVVSRLIGGIAPLPKIIADFNSQPTQFKWSRQSVDRRLRPARRTKIVRKL